MFWVLILVAGISLFAFLIDRRNKKINNSTGVTKNPGAKPGESSNYTMGDNHFTHGE
ncbi:hypothetical protein [Neobacillus terrae]|uniref:hypothetical protein n=1 Tax=Neobacillus terrae TaxID=3034837 RepID=UPI00140A69D6|nr:hypothetical protein [Neobacillus terrae]NHM31879.1 hypothetical protein [Neobacillus terrae]